MRKLGGEEWLVSAVRTVYGNTNTKHFKVKVGKHQVSALSP